jgi:hypothetical protein
MSDYTDISLVFNYRYHAFVLASYLFFRMHMKELRNLDRRLLKNETLLQKWHKATFSAWLDDKVSENLMLLIIRRDENNH